MSWILILRFIHVLYPLLMLISESLFLSLDVNRSFIFGLRNLLRWNIINNTPGAVDVRASFIVLSQYHSGLGYCENFSHSFPARDLGVNDNVNVVYACIFFSTLAFKSLKRLVTKDKYDFNILKHYWWMTNLLLSSHLVPRGFSMYTILVSILHGIMIF